MKLSITTNCFAEGCDVLLSGDLDLESATALRSELSTLVSGPAAGRQVRVDFGGVALVDSSGLSVLIGAHKLAVTHGTRLVLAALPRHVERTLSITGLDEVLEIDACADERSAAVEGSA